MITVGQYDAEIEEQIVIARLQPLGMLPGIAAFAFVSEAAIEAWHEPTVKNIALIAAAIVVWLSVVFGIQWALNRRSER